MLHRHFVRAVLLAALATPVAATPADAALERQYFGRTPQGLPLMVHGADDGTPRRLGGGVWFTCPERGFRIGEDLASAARLTAHGARRFTAEADRDVGEDAAGRRILVVAKLAGRRVTPRGRPGAEYWHGTLAVEVRLLDSDDGSVVDRCGSRTMRWRALREGYGRGRMTVSSDPGDFVGRGRSFTSTTVGATGDARRFGASSPAGGIGKYWTVSFQAPPGERLRAGRTYVVDLRAPPADAQILASAPDRHCDQPSWGEFTIDAVRFDRRGRLRSMKARFTHRCWHTPQAALRGSVSFRSRR